jgi:hypothetical protein
MGLIIPLELQRLVLCATVLGFGLFSYSCSRKQADEGSVKPIVNSAERDRLKQFISEQRPTLADIDRKVEGLKDWAERRSHDRSWLYPNAAEEGRMINETTAERDVAYNASRTLDYVSEQLHQIESSGMRSSEASEFLGELSHRSSLLMSIRNDLQATSDQIIRKPGMIPESLLSVAREADTYSPLDALCGRFLDKLNTQ